jgi:hypothetical protein
MPCRSEELEGWGSASKSSTIAKHLSLREKLAITIVDMGGGGQQLRCRSSSIYIPGSKKISSSRGLFAA